MKKRIMIIFAACLVGLVATAQISHSSAGQQDKTATQLMDKAAKRMSQNQGFDVGLKTYDAEKKETGSYQAQVNYDRGRYHLYYGQTELVSDGTTLWQIDKQAREVTVMNVETNDDINPLNPAQLLKGYAEAFRAKYIRTEADGTAVVDLQPRSARSYHKIRLLIDSKSGLLKQIELHKYDSSREVYVLNKFRKAPTKNEEYNYDATRYAGMDVNDLR